MLAQADVAREPAVQRPQDLSVESQCDPVAPGDRSAVFTWTPPSGENVRQLLDITMFRDGFRTGNFRTIGRLSAQEGRFVWPGGEPGISYLWRVRVIAPGDAAFESEPARFDPPVCPVDFQREGGDVEGRPEP